MAHSPAPSVIDKKYQAEDDARTIMRAMEVTKDKDRHAAAIKEMEKQQMNMDNALSMMDNMKGGKMSPQAFDMCVSEGGRVRTMPVKGGRHMKICFDKNGKSHPGEVSQTKGDKGK